MIIFEEMNRYYTENGFAVFERFYNEGFINDLIDVLEQSGALSYDTAMDANLYRSVPAVKELCVSAPFIELIREATGLNAKPVKAFILDKTSTANWGLDWHQDLKITVKEKIEAEGYHSWTTEAGITHVVPPINILQNMTALRIHLDDCNEQNGAMWVLPGTHRQGIIDAQDVPVILQGTKIFTCNAAKGSVMLMSQLLLHKSPYSLSEMPRRVLHIEYSAEELAEGLEWW